MVGCCFFGNDVKVEGFDVLVVVLLLGKYWYVGFSVML